MRRRSMAHVIWSRRNGYLAKGTELCSTRSASGAAFPSEVVPPSGHANRCSLNPRRLIPIHTVERARSPELFDNVSLIADGEWVGVYAESSIQHCDTAKGEINERSAHYIR
jgi:ribonuclease J